MDIWEANSNAAAFTPHVCNTNGQTRCSGVQCGDGDDRNAGLCDKSGCDFNSWRMGDKTFLGPGMTVDTSKKFTIVTQFITADNTTNGPLSEIRRLYVQNGQVIQNSKVAIPGIDPVNSITDEFCSQQKEVFNDVNYYQTLGGMAAMGDPLGRGMVLALSVWDDYAAQMLWLDSDYPTDASPSAPGVNRGPCAANSGAPADVEAKSGNAQVTYSTIKFVPIGSTFSGSSSGSPPPTPPASTANPPASTVAPPAPTGGAGTVAQWGQCGGIGYSGATACASPFTCHKLNDCKSCLQQSFSCSDHSVSRLLAVLLSIVLRGPQPPKWPAAKKYSDLFRMACIVIVTRGLWKYCDCKISDKIYISRFLSHHMQCEVKNRRYSMTR